jgi:hypothetical protein
MELRESLRETLERAAIGEPWNHGALLSKDVSGAPLSAPLSGIVLPLNLWSPPQPQRGVWQNVDDSGWKVSSFCSLAVALVCSFRHNGASESEALGFNCAILSRELARLIPLCPNPRRIEAVLFLMHEVKHSGAFPKRLPTAHATQGQRVPLDQIPGSGDGGSVFGGEQGGSVFARELADIFKAVSMHPHAEHTSFWLESCRLVLEAPSRCMNTPRAAADVPPVSPTDSFPGEGRRVREEAADGVSISFDCALSRVIAHYAASCTNMPSRDGAGDGDGGRQTGGERRGGGAQLSLAGIDPNTAIERGAAREAALAVVTAYSERRSKRWVWTRVTGAFSVWRAVDPFRANGFLALLLSEASGAHSQAAKKPQSRAQMAVGMEAVMAVYSSSQLPRSASALLSSSVLANAARLLRHRTAALTLDLHAASRPACGGGGGFCGGGGELVGSLVCVASEARAICGGACGNMRMDRDMRVERAVGIRLATLVGRCALTHAPHALTACAAIALHVLGAHTQRGQEEEDRTQRGEEEEEEGAEFCEPQIHEGDEDAEEEGAGVARAKEGFLMEQAREILGQEHAGERQGGNGYNGRSGESEGEGEGVAYFCRLFCHLLSAWGLGQSQKVGSGGGGRVRVRGDEGVAGGAGGGGCLVLRNRGAEATSLAVLALLDALLPSLALVVCRHTQRKREGGEERGEHLAPSSAAQDGGKTEGVRGEWQQVSPTLLHIRNWLAPDRYKLASAFR